MSRIEVIPVSHFSHMEVSWKSRTVRVHVDWLECIYSVGTGVKFSNPPPSCSIAAEKRFIFWIRGQPSKEWQWVRSVGCRGNTNTTVKRSRSCGSRWTSSKFYRVAWRSCFLMNKLTSTLSRMREGHVPYGTKNIWRWKCEVALPFFIARVHAGL